MTCNITKLSAVYRNLIKGYQSKIKIYFSTKSIGDDFNPREENYTETLLNPITILGYVREIDAERLVWKQYGLERIGAVEVLTDSKYLNLFKKAAKIEIESQEYMVYKKGGSGLIQKRPFNMIRVVLEKIN